MTIRSILIDLTLGQVLKNSLINNLLYNERRQQDSIKLFEISDIYYIDKEIKNKKVLGIICSGRIGKNYIDFSKKKKNRYKLSKKDYYRVVFRF